MEDDSDRYRNIIKYDSYGSKMEYVSSFKAYSYIIMIIVLIVLVLMMAWSMFIGDMTMGYVYLGLFVLLGLSSWGFWYYYDPLNKYSPSRLNYSQR